MKMIDWNTASELGLIVEINRRFLHPLGLAIVRDGDSGNSPCLSVSPDWEWAYPEDAPLPPLADTERLREVVTAKSFESLDVSTPHQSLEAENAELRKKIDDALLRKGVKR